MPQRKLLLLILTFNISIGISQAQPDESMDPCGSSTTIGMMLCNKQKLSVEDKKLNELYKELRAKTAPGSNEEEYLIKAEKAWIKFRDATCQYESAEVEGGAMYGVYVSACNLEQTKIRIKQLQRYIDNMS